MKYTPALAAILAMLCSAPSASAHIWDRVVWNDVELRIDIIPAPLDLFAAKVGFDDTLDLFVPERPSFAAPPAISRLTPRPRRVAGYAPYTPVYNWCCATSDTPDPHAYDNPTPTPVPLPSTAWMLAPALLMLLKVGRQA